MGGHRGIPLAERYSLLSVVGRGGMGVVWRAHDELLERDVAVKEVRLPGRLTAGERRLLYRRLIEEARATAALRHPGVVDVHDVVIEDGRPWIVMELLRARSLQREIAENGPLSVQRAARIGRSVLSVLDAAHGAGILHRDVKPSNVLLCEDGRVLLTDFGLAVHLDEGRQQEDTLVAGIEGSPAYLAPERIRSEAGVRESDLWSLGVTLYTAVEGVSPFLRCHALASMLAVLLGDYAPPARAGRLTPVIEGLLQHDPCARMKAVDAAQALGAIGPRKVRVQKTRHGRRLVASLGVVAAAAVVLGAWNANWESPGKSELALLSVAGGDSSTVGYRDQQAGYTVDVPKGWQRERLGASVQWSNPGTGWTLRITPIGGDPLAGLRAEENEATATFPGYRLLRLEPLQGTQAEWEFTWGKEQARMHVLHNRAAGYEFAFHAPDTRWTPAHRVYERVLESFSKA